MFEFFSETTGPTEAKFHMEPRWDREGKFIEMIHVTPQPLYNTVRYNTVLDMPLRNKVLNLRAVQELF